MVSLHVAEATLSSLRARRTFKAVKCNNSTRRRSNLLVTSCSSDALKFVVKCSVAEATFSDVQKCGEMQILHAPKQPSRDFVLDGTFKTVVTCKFVCVTTKPFRHFVVTSDVQNCGKTMIFVCRRRCRSLVLHIFAQAAVAKRTFRNI